MVKGYQQPTVRAARGQRDHRLARLQARLTREMLRRRQLEASMGLPDAGPASSPQLVARAEAALWVSEARYRSLFEDAPVALVEEYFTELRRHLASLREQGVTDLRTFFVEHAALIGETLALVRVTDANRAALDLYEARSKDELLTSLALLIPPESSDFMVDEFVALCDGEASWAQECVNRTLSGKRIDVRLRFSECPSGDHPSTRFLLSIEDVTERERSAEELRESRERLSLALKSSAMGCWDWRFQEDRLIWDDTVFAHYGLPPNGCVPSLDNFLKLVYPPDRAGTQQAIARSLADRSDYAVDYRTVWPDGSMHTIATRGRVHTDAQGRVNRMVGVSWDITEQKAAEEAIRRLNAELEQRVAQRTAEVAATAARLQLSNNSLQEAVEQLRELDRMKSQFVSNVSHELRTPLTNIKLYLDLLEHGKPEKHDKYMDTLKRETDLLQRLIEDLLHLSRLDMGKSQPVLAAVHLNDLASVLANDRAALFAERGLALRLALEQGLPPVSADNKLLTQVLTNLMANAMNYTPAFGTVTMRTQSHLDGAESWVILSVVDTGPGLSAEDQKHFCERFYRGEAARRSGAPGTGLGLAICQEIARLHGGRLTAESVPGRGSTFSLWLRPL